MKKILASLLLVAAVGLLAPAAHAQTAIVETVTVATITITNVSTTTATAVPAIPLPARTLVAFENIGTETVWVKMDTTVGINNGWKITPGGSLSIPIRYNTTGKPVIFYFKAESAAVKVVTLEAY